MTALESQPTSHKREHGLDALRAVLMLLGVAIHSVLNYHPDGVEGWFRDPFASSEWARFVGGCIHTFRMPAFFVLSGYFGALLWKRRGARAMLKNRFERIVLPLLVFVVALQPCIVFAGAYSRRVRLGEPTAFMSALEGALEADLLPDQLFHLWFLYYLAWVCVIVAGVVWFMNTNGLSWPNAMRRLRQICESPWKSTLAFLVPNLILSATLGWEGLPTYTGWIPHPIMLAFYATCYGLGWALFTADFDLSSLTRGSTALVSIGMLSALLGFLGRGSEGGLGRLEIGALACLSMVTLTRGLSGLFIRFASRASAPWRYVSDSSYWVYLAHLPLSILIPSMMMGWDLPFLPKWSCAMVLITLLCVATYDLAVRATPIGRLLNGRTYSRYSLKLSLGVTLILSGGVTWAMVSYTPIENLPSPWKDRSPIHELLPDETLDVPEMSVATGAYDCVGVEGYVVCPIPSAFSEAQKACEELDGHLALPTSAEEHERLSSLLNQVTRRTVWIGATDRAREEDWRAVTGGPLTYESWADGEPNNLGNEDCAAHLPRHRNWIDRGCESRLYFVCDRPLPGE